MLAVFMSVVVALSSHTHASQTHATNFPTRGKVVPGRNIGGICTPDQAIAPRVIEPAVRTCMLDGSTVSSKSTVCKSGIMFVCDDGDWRNLGVPCR